MAGTVHRLVPRREALSREALGRLVDLVRGLSDDELPAAVRAAWLNELHRRVRPDTENPLWPGGFNMLSRAQTAAVWKAIRALPSKDRPNLVRHVFDLVLLNLRQDTGEVMLTRDQFADETGAAPRDISSAMTTLQRLGVITRERRRVEGMRGPGVVAYFINPHVAWNGSLDARRAAAEESAPPLLRLIEGGAASSEPPE